MLGQTRIDNVESFYYQIRKQLIDIINHCCFDKYLIIYISVIYHN